ncbi:MAG: transcriptional regulator, LuxR family [Chthonomonadaceae bacterium]|nr:transcriptional regulator, LuxR family [Chthonomonadaceae bacterium]
MTHTAEKPPIPSLEVRLFGGFEARVDDRPLPPLRSRREQWLLALLVLRQDRDTSRDWLASTLWPDNEEAQALFYLRKALSNLRQALGTEAVRLQIPDRRSVRLEMAGAFADVVAFDSALKRAVGVADPAALLQEAVALYRGPLLPDCPEEWANVERNRREQAYLTALEALATHGSAQGDHAAAVHWLRLLTSADPYRESAYGSLMQALADCGDSAAISVVYQELRARLHQDLNAAPDPQIEALYRQLRRLERPTITSQLRPHSPPETRRHLPVPLSDLIGRKEEIAEVLDWIQRRRLVTLLGVGGIGKTRLAIAVAEEALPRFEQGVWFVDLAPLSEASLVLQATAKALGVAEAGSRPLLETLVEALASRSLLLVLDNCEHLPDSCAELAYSLLSACPSLCIVATSRQALNVTGEQIYRVPSLPVPPLNPLGQDADHAIQEKDPHFLMEYEAVRLFVDRASRVNGAFVFHRRNALAVVKICRQLDGIPLAIEMAAARLRSLSVGEIQTRLADRFRLLTSGNRGVLPRQQTLRAAIDWSYDLLNGAERVLLSRLSVFSGGWTLEEAESVCGGEPVEASQILEMLTSLADKSLVITEEVSGATRYRMLETMKQYAQDRLAEKGEGGFRRDRHLECFLALAEEAALHLVGREALVWQDRLEREHDNVRSALAWATEDGTDPESGLRICGALLYFWMGRGYLGEGRNWCRAALDRANQGVRSAARAATLHCEGRLAYAQGDYAAARAPYEESLSISREREDRRGVAQALNGLGMLNCDQGDYGPARAFHEQSLAIRRELGDPWTTSQSLCNLGELEAAQGHYSSARSFLEESLSIRRRVIGVHRGTAIVLHLLGKVAYEEGDYADARSLLEESLSMRREVADLPRFAESLMSLGKVAYESGDFVSARSLGEESLSISRALRLQDGIAMLLDLFAELALVEGDVFIAARLWGAAESLREKLGGSLWHGAQRRHDASVAASRAALGDDHRFDAAWQEGRIMTTEQAIEYALGG